MRTSLAVIAVLCLSPAVASAEGESPPPKRGVLDDRLLLPSLVGYGVGTMPYGLALGSGAVGFTTYATGVVSYSSGDSSSGGASAHSDAFVLDPNFDVRVGRFTIGGSVSFAYVRTTQGAVESDATSFALSPRVGYLVPLARGVALWPRASVGFLYGRETATGFPDSSVNGLVASADLLVAVDLVPHFFLTAGPSAWFSTASAADGAASSFGVGASVGLGIAL